MDFILNNLPMLITAVVGIALLVVETFMPGFGIPGISGIALLIGTIVMTWMKYGPLAGLGATVVVLALAGIVISLSLKSAATGRISRSSLILRDTVTRGAEETAEKEIEALMGITGEALTVLRPSGIAEFDGVRVDVVSDGEYIEKGAKVEIKLVEGKRVQVTRVS